MGERFVSKCSYKVDGFCEETNTVYTVNSRGVFGTVVTRAM